MGTTNLKIEPGPGDRAELLRQAGDGLFVTEVAGLHSGAYLVQVPSVGASGLLIADGELGAPAREMTIAGDLVLGMLKAVRTVGPRPAGCPSAAVSRPPPILIAEMAISGS